MAKSAEEGMFGGLQDNPVKAVTDSLLEGVKMGRKGQKKARATTAASVGDSMLHAAIGEYTAQQAHQRDKEMVSHKREELMKVDPTQKFASFTFGDVKGAYHAAPVEAQVTPTVTDSTPQVPTGATVSGSDQFTPVTKAALSKSMKPAKPSTAPVTGVTANPFGNGQA